MDTHPLAEYASVEDGFIRAGHLYGHQALVVAVVDGGGDPALNADLAVRQRRPRRVHIEAAPASMRRAVLLARRLGASAPWATVSLGLRPGCHGSGSDAIVYESVLSLREGDATDDLDPRAGSVCFHYWPGEAALQEVEDRCDAPYGYYLVLPQAQIGEAKVWLAATRDAGWQLVHDYPLELTEDAELVQMTHGRPR